MDPASYAGLIAASFEFGKFAKEFYDLVVDLKKTSSPEKVREIIAMAHRVQQAAEDMEKLSASQASIEAGLLSQPGNISPAPTPNQATPTQTMHDEEKAWVALCKETASSILAFVKELQVLPKARVKDVVKAAIKTMIKRGTLATMEQKLERLQEVYSSKLLTKIWHGILLEHMKSEKRESDMVAMAEKLLTAESDVRLTHEQLDAVLKQNALVIRDELANQTVRWTRWNMIITDLASHKTKERRTQITSVDDTTLKWVLGASSDGVDTEHKLSLQLAIEAGSILQEWLVRGSQFFWIKGKPGCGKSTLLKYLVDDSRTSALLSEWTERLALEVLFKPEFFFWKAGTSEQNTAQGFLRSCLYDILRAFPDLADEFLEPGQDAGTSHDMGRHILKPLWNESSLARLLLNLCQRAGNIASCFFIDGLDEIDDYYHQELLFDTLRRLCSLQNVKLCISSRNSPDLERLFHGYKSLMLENVVQSDIKSMVDQKLDPVLAARPALRKVISVLKRQLVRKAEGMFLWIALVLPDIVRALQDPEPEEELSQILRNLPKSLKDAYLHALSSIPSTQMAPPNDLIQQMLVHESTEMPANILLFTLARPEIIDRLLPILTNSADTNHIRSRVDAFLPYLSERAEAIKNQIKGRFNVLLTFNQAQDISFNLASLFHTPACRAVLFFVNTKVAFAHPTLRDALLDGGLVEVTSLTTKLSPEHIRREAQCLFGLLGLLMLEAVTHAGELHPDRESQLSRGQVENNAKKVAVATQYRVEVVYRALLRIFVIAGDLSQELLQQLYASFEALLSPYRKLDPSGRGETLWLFKDNPQAMSFCTVEIPRRFSRLRPQFDTLGLAAWAGLTSIVTTKLDNPHGSTPDRSYLLRCAVYGLWEYVLNVYNDEPSDEMHIIKLEPQFDLILKLLEMDARPMFSDDSPEFQFQEANLRVVGHPWLYFIATICYLPRSGLNVPPNLQAVFNAFLDKIDRSVLSLHFTFANEEPIIFPDMGDLTLLTDPPPFTVNALGLTELFASHMPWYPGLKFALCKHAGDYHSPHVSLSSQGEREGELKGAILLWQGRLESIVGHEQEFIDLYKKTLQLWFSTSTTGPHHQLDFLALWERFWATVHEDELNKDWNIMLQNEDVAERTLDEYDARTRSAGDYRGDFRLKRLLRNMLALNTTLEED